MNEAGASIPAADPATDPVTDPAAASRWRRRRVGPVLLVAWAVVLALGFGVVFTLGAPLPTSTVQRADAYAPLPLPVTEASVTAAADQIVRLDYPQFADAPRTVRQGTSHGVGIWTVTYSVPGRLSGVRIVILASDGTITVEQLE